MTYDEWYEVHWQMQGVWDRDKGLETRPGIEKFTDYDEAQETFCELAEDKWTTNVKFFRQSTVELASHVKAPKT